MTCFRPSLSWRDSNTFDWQCVYRYRRQAAANPLLTFRERNSRLVFSSKKFNRHGNNCSSTKIVFNKGQMMKREFYAIFLKNCVKCVALPMKMSWELTSISFACFGTRSSPVRLSSLTTSPTLPARRRPDISVCENVFPAPRFATW